MLNFLWINNIKWSIHMSNIYTVIVFYTEYIIWKYFLCIYFIDFLNRLIVINIILWAYFYSQYFNNTEFIFKAHPLVFFLVFFFAGSLMAHFPKLCWRCWQFRHVHLPNETVCPITRKILKTSYNLNLHTCHLLKYIVILIFILPQNIIVAWKGANRFF